MQEKAKKYVRICLRSLIIVTIVMLWIARDSTAQQSVRLPDSWKTESEQLDDLLLQIDLAKEQYRVKVERLQRDKTEYINTSRLASPGAARKYYEEMIHQIDAEMLLARHQLSKEIQLIATKAIRTAGQLIVTVESTDFGQSQVEAKIETLHNRQSEVRERIRNHDILNEYGGLNSSEQLELKSSRDWQEKRYRLWVREARWYSDLLNRVLQKSRHFRNATQFVENLIEDLQHVIQSSNSEIASIRAIASAEKASAVRRL